MTVFAKRAMDLAGWSKVKDQVGALMISMGGPHDLMMYRVKTDDFQVDEIFLGLPDKLLLGAFPGFVEIERDAIPDYLTTLIVREDGFQELFPDIAAKRRVKFG